jgi:hypothetical protein
VHVAAQSSLDLVVVQPMIIYDPSNPCLGKATSDEVTHLVQIQTHDLTGFAASRATTHRPRMRAICPTAARLTPFGAPQFPPLITD